MELWDWKIIEKVTMPFLKIFIYINDGDCILINSNEQMKWKAKTSKQKKNQGKKTNEGLVYRLVMKIIPPLGLMIPWEYLLSRSKYCQGIETGFSLHESSPLIAKMLLPPFLGLVMRKI